MPEKLLQAKSVKDATPRDKVYYLSDGAGLRLQVRPDGAKYWIFRFRLGGKESSTSLGVYPDVSLAEARQKAEEAAKDVARGRNPSLERRLRKDAQIESDATTFSGIAKQWLDFHMSKPEPWSEHHRERNEGLLRRILLPALGKLPAKEINEQRLLRVLSDAYRKTPESARRARQVASQVFRFGKDSHLCDNNPAADLARTSRLPRVRTKHFAAMPKTDVGPFLRALDRGGVEKVTRVALLAALYLGLRDYSIRGATWSEVDLDKGVWLVPGKRMKRGEDLLTPMPKQMVDELRALRPVTDKGPETFVFASYGKHGFIAENSLRIALHRLGFEVTLHGFRSLLTDTLNEARFNADAIERQLDHVERNAVRRAYLRADFIEERVRMLTWYADWCDQQRDGAQSPDNVVPLRAAS